MNVFHNRTNITMCSIGFNACCPIACCSALEVGVIRGEVTLVTCEHIPVWVCAQPMTAAIQPGRWQVARTAGSIVCFGRSLHTTRNQHAVS